MAYGYFKDLTRRTSADKVSEADLGLLQHPRWNLESNDWKLLTVIVKCSTLDVAVVLDPPLVLYDKAFNIAKIPKYDGYLHGLASMVYKFFDKKLQVVLLNSIMQNEELAKELYKPIIKKCEKRKVYSSFIDNIGVLILQMCN